jgi:outer membrane protein assembly factor BamB
VSAEPRNSTVTYPGGLRARWRWAGSGEGAAVFALSEVGGRLVELGTRVTDDPEPLCRAELRLDGPRGAWTARFASRISDEPRAIHLDDAGLLVVSYGFHTFGLDVATGEAGWEHRSGTPIVALLGSPRLPHVIVQAELETFAIEPDGTVAWRVAHSDVVVGAEMVGGRLVLTGYSGQLNTLDPSTGRSAA